MTPRMTRITDPAVRNQLAVYVRERRDFLGLTQEDVRGVGGPSTATMRLIEGALQDSYRPSILRGLERALRWAPNSVDQIIDGGPPTPLPDEADDIPSTPAETAAAILALSTVEGLPQYEVDFLRGIAQKIAQQDESHPKERRQAAG